MKFQWERLDSTLPLNQSRRSSLKLGGEWRRGVELRTSKFAFNSNLNKGGKWSQARRNRKADRAKLTGRRDNQCATVENR